MGRNNSVQTCNLKQTSTDTVKSLFKKYFVMKKAQKHEKGRKERFEVTYTPLPPILQY
jgi:hypothetical protein